MTSRPSPPELQALAALLRTDIDRDAAHEAAETALASIDESRLEWLSRAASDLSALADYTVGRGR